MRRVKAALIDRVAAFGRFDVPKRFASPKDEAAWILQHFCGATLWKGRPKFAIDPLPAMPSQEPQRTAEAVRRTLPNAQAAALRSPRRHPKRPGNSRYRAAGPQSMIRPLPAFKLLSKAAIFWDLSRDLHHSHVLFISRYFDSAFVIQAMRVLRAPVVRGVLSVKRLI